MTNTLTIAVAHYPEGAGHATRMLAIADALSDAGAEIEFAGGGAGTQFAALNGYDEFEPAVVDYIDTYQGGSMREVFAESVPATAERVTDYVEWLRDTDPDALVTDDMFAAIAATRTDVPLYVLKHDLPDLYRDRVERTGAAFHTEFQRSAAREFFYPAVWPSGRGLSEPAAGSGDSPDDDSVAVTRVPPVALDGDEAAGPDPASAPDVVVVPSHYSELGRVADNLERQGYDVLDVGSDEWDPVASLLPYLRAADVVVCSGYSTVMDAAVAGTPCVVHPATDEQEAVADRLDGAEVPGFAVAETPIDVLDAVASPPDRPSFENGATDVAASVLADLRSGAAIAGAAGDGDGTGSTADGAALVDRAVAGAAALGTATRATAHCSRLSAVLAGEYASHGAVVVSRYGLRALDAAVTYATAAGLAAVRRTRRALARTRRAAHTGRRYATALAALSVAVFVVADSGARSTGGRLAGGLAATGSALRRGALAGLAVTAAGCERLAGGFQRAAGILRQVADRSGETSARAGGLLGGVGRRLREVTRPAE